MEIHQKPLPVGTEYHCAFVIGGHLLLERQSPTDLITLIRNSEAHSFVAHFPPKEKPVPTIASFAEKED
ncbi:hypothetical protein TNCV_1889281 [Trichonephila clavipes]|nr:hypothetical protein TNCV_1889281 [Trichonephila clavipes]